jgi:subtilisin family serine protease
MIGSPSSSTSSPPARAGLPAAPALRILLGALLAVVMPAGCASSASTVPGEAMPPAPPAAQAPDPDFRDAPDAEATPETEGPPAVRRAPDDWHLLDPEADGWEGASIRGALEALARAGRTAGEPVVVAILDSGVDTTHTLIRPYLWENPGEVGGTGRDDDGNGYVDDLRGWSFLGGPDGRSVGKDTWEVARLQALCTDPDSAPPSPPPLPEPGSETCREVARDLEEKAAEARAFLQNVEGITQALDVVLPLLERALERDGLGREVTPEAVARLSPRNPQEREARGFFLQLADLGATPDDVAEAREELQSRLEYKLNPAFDPREIVGDDYTDPHEWLYGSHDVVGPDPRHGTHVAGIVLSAVAGTPAPEGSLPIRIMTVRAVPDGDERDKDVANAIRYAADNGARVLNLSFGKDWSPQREVVEAAIRHADSLGVLLVHAAGNDGRDVETRGSFPTPEFADGTRARNWITVGALSWRGADTLVASFSNWGPGRVDLFAPGEDITAAAAGGGTETNSGTSMAAPVVAGVAALLLAHFPELDAAQVREILLETATRHPAREVILPGTGEAMGEPEVRRAFGELSATGGVVNARAAVEEALARVGGSESP